MSFCASSSLGRSQAAPQSLARAPAQPHGVLALPSCFRLNFHNAEVRGRRSLLCLQVGRSTAAANAAEAQSQPAAAGQDDWIEVGYITVPHGVYGEMKVQPMTDFPEERLAEPGPRWLQAPALKLRRSAAEAPRRVELEGGRPMVSKGQEIWLVKLEGVDSPEEAELLRGHRLLIPASARPELVDEDEFYMTDLIGLRVFLQASGEELGEVVDMFDGTGTHDLLRIRLQQQQQQCDAVGLQVAATESEPVTPASDAVMGGAVEEDEPRYLLLPFAKAMVPVVDVAAGRMEVIPPEGLLELAMTPTQRVLRTENRGRRQRRRRRPRSSNGSSSSEGAHSEADSSNEHS